MKPTDRRLVFIEIASLPQWGGSPRVQEDILSYASWGLDYLKVDDLVNPTQNPRTPYYTQIEGYRKAIDADMIPLGYLSERGPVGGPRYSNLSATEQTTMMTMWTIFRSPLIWGGDLRRNRAQEDSLMRNEEVVAVNQHGQNPRPLSTSSNAVVWASNHPDSASVKYVALVNLSGSTANVSVNLGALGFKAATEVRNLWTRKNLGSFNGTFSQSLPSHGSGLYKVWDPSAVSVVPRQTSNIPSSNNLLRVVGARWIVPASLEGKPLSLRVYGPDGHLINSLATQGEPVVRLDRGIAPLGATLLLVGAEEIRVR